MNSSRGLGRGRGRGSRPGPPSWPHGTTPEDRRNFTPNKSAETREPPEVDWDEIRHRERMKLNPEGLPEDDLGLIPAEREVFQKILNRTLSLDGMKSLFAKDGIEPFHAAVAISKHMNDFFEGRPKTEAYKVLIQLETFLEGPAGKDIPSPSLPFHRAVFRTFIHHKSSSMRQLAFRVCRLSESKEAFIPAIGNLSKDTYFDIACDAAHSLRLHAVFAKETFLLPLIIEDKTPLVEKYLEDAPRGLQIEVVEWLDSLEGDNGKKISDMCRAHPNPKAASAKRLLGKPLGRFIDALLEKFKIDGDKHAPRVVKSRRHGAFKYLVGRKADANTRRENWRDLVYENCKSDPVLQKRLLEYLTDGRSFDFDYDEATYFVHRLQITLELIPHSLELHMKEAGGGERANGRNFDEETWDNEKNDDANQYHKLKLDKNCIVFVTSRQCFLEAVTDLSNSRITGIDAEHRPCSLMCHERVALVQVATNTSVYIFDMIRLAEVLSIDDWREMNQKYFSNTMCIILGYGIKGDLSTISRSLREPFVDLPKTAASVVDLALLDRRLSSVSMACPLKKTFPTTASGLSGLVESLFQKPLNKMDQMSDWDKRPLTENQFLYAALDAHVLIEVYEELSRLCLEQECSAQFHKFFQECIETKNTMPKASKSARVSTTEEEREEVAKLFAVPLFDEEIKPEELKVVCDNHLGPLCKKLRHLGVDSVIIESFESHESLTKVALRDERMIITKSRKNFDAARKAVVKGRCVLLTPDQVEDQLAEITRYFNITISEDNIFRRCSLCNGDRYITIPRNLMKQLRANKSRRPNSGPNMQPDGFDDDDLDDDEKYEMVEEDGHDDEEDHSVANSPWVTIDGVEVNPLAGVTRGGVELQIAEVEEAVIEKYEEFFCCNRCGKVFWQGSHWGKTKEKVFRLKPPVLKLN